MATVIEGLIYRADGKYEPHLVHRLDKLTSGVLLAAKNKQTTRELSEIIKSNSSEKYYKTLVYGVPKMKKAFIESVVDGKEAILEYETEKIFNTSLGRFSLVDINLITGRKHQIRVQFSGKNLPVLGDDYYGDKEINKLFRKNFGLKRFFLHAYKMKFQFKDKKYTFTADLYKDLSEVLKRLEFSESGD
jgi:23S rRNA pseudouridine955/2504/2580 synthase